MKISETNMTTDFGEMWEVVSLMLITSVHLVSTKHRSRYRLSVRLHEMLINRPTFSVLSWQSSAVND